ncbi:hypothetical protein L7F22_021605 [Adiantum nelumboides]|nr:hypothetical protein [Adiantum nelumboides]
MPPVALLCPAMPLPLLLLLLCALSCQLLSLAPLLIAAQPLSSPTNVDPMPPAASSPTNFDAMPPAVAFIDQPAPTPSPFSLLLPASQQVALLALLAEWQDPNGRLATWTASNGANACSWWGVTCSADNSSITSLYLSGLSLSGTLSPAIANLSSLSTLNLSHNNFSGPIPAELGSLPFLTILYLAHNHFSGSIPSALFLSSSLQFLLLDSNNLSGEVPSTMANLGNLRYLSLQFNALTGAILSSIANLSKLAAIYVGNNEFNGRIPSQFGNLNRLVYLDLGGNLFTGSIPSSIGSLTLLRELRLQENWLEGPLPPELGNLHNVISMNLSHNFLNGTIPSEIGSISSVQVLDLCMNHLEGSIPPSLGNLSMLKSLNLSFNNLSGGIPMNGVLANFNYSSYVGNVLLCGDPLMEAACDRSPERMKHRMPYNRNGSPLGKDGKVTIIVVVGAFGLVVIFVFLVFCYCRPRQEEVIIERSVERGARNSFSVDVAESMRKAKLEIYMEGFPHNYEEIVSNAGYFDTAHVLGKGRFASVYKSDLPSGRHLAVKVFNNPITQSTFEREVAHLHESASQVSTLLPIRGYYSNPIEKAIFYDFMPKGTLYDLLQSSPTLLDWSKRINIALGVAHALSHLHKGCSSKILHMDLKSSNVLLDDFLNPLVADYGLMGLVSKTVVETPGYTPPEFTFLSYSVRRYSEKTDVYSFGILLLELLTGKSPVCHEQDNNRCSHDEEDKSIVSHDEERNPASNDEERLSSDDEERISTTLQGEENVATHDEEVSHAPNQEEEFETKAHLLTWVLSLHKEGRGLQVLSPFVMQSCPSLDHQVQAYNLAIRCIDDEPIARPSMPEIISIFERLVCSSSPIGDAEHQSKGSIIK